MNKFEKQLKELFQNLKGAYKYMTRKAGSIYNIFTSKSVSFNDALRVMDDEILVDIRDLQMVKNQFDIAFAMIRMIFKLNFNIDYDSIMEDSVIKYCKGQTDFIEYYVMKNDKQIWKKYYIK